MRHLKVLCLAAVASGALFVGFGSGTAVAAIELCSTNTSPCTGVKYALPVEFESKLTAKQEAVFTFSFITDKCTISNIEWKAEDEKAGRVTGPITKLSFGSC